MSASPPALGDTLRALRKARGWSLDHTAAATGVSKAMLGQIERGESSPTVATLWKLAGGLQLSLSQLLEPSLAPAAPPRPPERRDAHALRRQPASDAMLVAPLFPYDPAVGFGLFELTLPPGYQRLADAHVAGVSEYVLVIAGCLDLWLNGNWQPLSAGQALRFAADQAHGYRISGSTPTVFHNLIHYAGSARAAMGWE